MKCHTLSHVTVRAMSVDPQAGKLFAGGTVFRCALGRTGIRHHKREGDGATPKGRYRPLAGFWRADRLPRPQSPLCFAPIARMDGWCDDPADANYNKPVRLPYPASVEAMRREDHLYDIVVDLSWNRGPIRKYGGSAIFLHVASDGYGPTEGCVALALPDLRKLLALIGRDTIFEVGS